MAYIILPARRQIWQPMAGFRVRPEYVRGLTFLSVASHGPINLLDLSATWTSYGTVTPNPSQRLGVAYDGSAFRGSWAITNNAIDPAGGNSSASFLVFSDITTGNAYGFFFGVYGTGNSQQYFAVGPWASNACIVAAYNQSAAGTPANLNGLGPVGVAAAGSSGESKAFLNGAQWLTANFGPNSGGTGGRYQWNGSNSLTSSHYGKTALAAWWTNRRLTDRQLAALSADPYGELFIAPQSRIYVPSAGGGAVTGTISESGTLASSFSSSLLAKATLAESATLASSFAGKVIYPVSLEEVATLASTFSGGVLYSVSVEESGTLADSVTSIITINRTLSESATLDSGFTSSAVFSSTITEAATLASPLQGLGNFLGTFSESGTLDYSLTSSVESAGAYSGTILEAATLASSFASVLIAKGTLAESATLADSYVSSWSGSVTYVESGTLAFTVSANTGAPSGGSTGGGGGIRTIPLGQDYTMMVKMVDIDGTGVAGLTLSFTASKAGGVFNSLSPSVVDRGSGWYAVTIDAADLDTEGEFVLTVEGSGAETQAVISQVALSTQDAVVAALTAARLLTLGQFLALK